MQLLITTNFEISLKSLYKIIHARQDIENSIFYNLKTHCALERCFVHEPNAIEAIVYCMIIASNVTFHLDIIYYEDNSLKIKGTTNLFDKASLILSIRNSDGILMRQSKSIVENGKIDFSKIYKENSGFDKGEYVAHISGALPSVQDKEFVRKAGIEYENLKDECIDRTGVRPTIKYKKEFEI